MRFAISLVAASLALASAIPAYAHPGGLNGEGCHNNRRTGDYHCHKPNKSASAAARPVQRASGSSYFPNCAAARAAGAAPLRRGDAGYRAALDRDNDGIACE